MSVRSTLGRFGIVTVDAMRAIVDHADGSPTVLAVYVTLATHADRDEQESWRCSVKAIAEEAGVSERSVRTAKKVLVELGLLEVSSNFTPDGDRGWDSYLLHYGPRHAPDAGGAAPDAGGAAEVAAYSSDQETDQETELLAPSQAMDASDDADFELFWATYRRTGPKKKAKECWRRAIKKADAAVILDGLIKWMAYWDTPGAANIKWPQGWLSEERWNDDPPITTIAPRKESGMDVLRRIAERDNA